MSYEEVLLTGIRAAVQNADRNNLTWDITLGTVVNVGQQALNTYQVMCDGDNTVLTITSLAGTLYTGSRVYVVKVPPNSLYILGATVTMLVAPPPGPVQPLPPLIPGIAVLAAVGPAASLEINAEGPPVAVLDAVGPSPDLTIESESDVVRAVVFEDFFERTVVGLQEWGAPDLGPDWFTESVGTGQLVQVDSGYGEIINEAPTYVRSLAQLRIGTGPTALELTNFSIEMLDIQADVPASGSWGQVDARNGNAQIYWNYLADGTVEIYLWTGLDEFGPIPIPDITSTQPMDIYFRVIGIHAQVWTALHSVGIDLNDPPLIDNFTEPPSEGPFGINFFGEESAEAGALRIGEMRIWDEPPLDEELLVVEDLFDRTVTGLQEWGTPNIGPDWSTEDVDSDQIIQVDDDSGQFINEVTYGGVEAVIQSGASSFEPAHYAIEALDIQVVVGASGGTFAAITARNTDNELFWQYLGDGTAEVTLFTGIDTVGPIPIPDVTADQPIDIYMKAVGEQIQVWIALTSVGIDLGDPPLFDEVTASASYGPITFNFGSDVIEEEASLSYGEIRIWIEPDPPPPPTGLLLEDLFERVVTGLQEWGTPDTGNPWVTDFFADGQLIQVDDGAGKIINEATYDGNIASIVASIPDIKNYSIEIIGMEVVPPPSDCSVDISARDFDNELTIFWYADGTAEAFLATGVSFLGPVAIPGVTASQPIDIYMRCIDDHIQVWTALTSVGIDLEDPPLFDEVAFDGFAGPITVVYSGQLDSEESSISFGEFRIWNEGE